MTSAEAIAKPVANIVAKEKKPRASRGSKPAPSHPTYLQMTKEAIISLKERNGSIQFAIAAYIGIKYQSHVPANFKKLLTVQLGNLAKSGKLTKVKNSFKLSEELRKPVKPKAPSKKLAAKPKASPGPKKVSKPAKSPVKVVKAPRVLKRKPTAAPKKVEKAAAPATKAAPAKMVAPANKAVLAKKPAPAKKPVKTVKRFAPLKPKKLAPAAKKAKK